MFGYNSDVVLKLLCYNSDVVLKLLCLYLFLRAICIVAFVRECFPHYVQVILCFRLFWFTLRLRLGSLGYDNLWAMLPARIIHS